MPQRAVHQASLAVALIQNQWRPEHAKVVVSAWHKSGLSMSDFARDHGPSFDRLNVSVRWSTHGKARCVLEGVLHRRTRYEKILRQKDFDGD
jgi:hypothetical protein